MQSGHDRRDFIKKGLLLGGAASLLTAGLTPMAAAQTVGKAVRRPDRYADSYIFERKPFSWPGNKTLAVWVAPNVEVWNFDSPVGVGVFRISETSCRTSSIMAGGNTACGSACGGWPMC
jgi:hypothetical protein